MALLILLQPIFEADFDEGSFGYRPGRKAHQALDAIREQLRHGRTEVVDADLSGYFDTIDHAGLLRLVAGRVSDGSILRLVKLFLKAPIVEEKKGKRSYHKNDRGTPQGGVLSPLLANLYLNSLDHGVNDRPELDAKLIRYPFSAAFFSAAFTLRLTQSATGRQSRRASRARRIRSRSSPCGSI